MRYLRDLDWQATWLLEYDSIPNDCKWTIEELIELIGEVERCYRIFDAAGITEWLKARA